MWNPFRQPAPPPPPAPPEPLVATVAMTAQPLVVGRWQDPVAYARYRLDAIRRHIAQHAELAPGRMDEFRVETFNLVHALHVAKVITPDEEAAALTRVGIGGPV
jgi:hypothetical protein